MGHPAGRDLVVPGCSLRLTLPIVVIVGMDTVLFFSWKVLSNSLGWLERERSELPGLACCDFKDSVGSRPSVILTFFFLNQIEIFKPFFPNLARPMSLLPEPHSANDLGSSTGPSVSLTCLFSLLVHPSYLSPLFRTPVFLCLLKANALVPDLDLEASCKHH